MGTGMATIVNTAVHQVGAEVASLMARMRPYEARLYRLIFDLTGKLEDAESVLISTYLQNWPQLRCWPEDEVTYRRLTETAIQKSLHLLLSRRRDELDGTDQSDEAATGEVFPWEANPEQRFSRDQWRQLLAGLLDTLSPLDRVVFVLCDIHKFFIPQVAAWLDMPEPEARRHLHRARLQLRARLAPWCREERQPEVPATDSDDWLDCCT